MEEIGNFLRDEWYTPTSFEGWPALPSKPGQLPTQEQANEFFLGSCIDYMTHTHIVWDNARRFLQDRVPPDPATNRIVASIQIPERPDSIAIGNGAVWVANRYGKVFRIDPKTNSVVATVLLIPPPRFHTLRGHGLLAPHAGWRSLIVPRPGEGAGQAGCGPAAGESARPGPGSPAVPAEPAGRESWAALLARVFALDVLQCPRLRRPPTDRGGAHRG